MTTPNVVSLLTWRELKATPLPTEEELAPYRCPGCGYPTSLEHQAVCEVLERRKKHGVSKERKAQMIREQEGLCALCGEPLDNRPHVDHCHSTGRVRGVLHGGCNLLIGLIEKRPTALANAKRYLETR